MADAPQMSNADWLIACKRCSMHAATALIILSLLLILCAADIGYQEPKPCTTDVDCGTRCDGLTWYRGYCEDSICKEDTTSCDDDIDCTKV